jgi:ribosome-binding factor A
MKPEEKLIQKEVARTLKREADFAGNPLITLTRVELNDKSDHVRLFISVLPIERQPEVIQVLNLLAGRLASKTKKRLRLRIIPHFFFVAETMTKEADEIERLLDSI